MKVSFPNHLLGSWDQARGQVVANFQRTTTAFNDIPPVPTYLPPRSVSILSSNTPAINTDLVDIYCINKLESDVLSFTTNLLGSPVEGQSLMIRVRDDGTPRSITWGAKFRTIDTLPVTTSASKYLYVELRYNAINSVWDCFRVIEEP